TVTPRASDEQNYIQIVRSQREHALPLHDQTRQTELFILCPNNRTDTSFNATLTINRMLTDQHCPGTIAPDVLDRGTAFGPFANRSHDRRRATFRGKPSRGESNRQPRLIAPCGAMCKGSFCTIRIMSPTAP